MPFSLVHPPKAANEDVSSWRHPMERITDLYFEAEMVMEKFHMPFHTWLQTVPKHVRLFQLAVYKQYIARENYRNTPKEKRFSFFSNR